MRPFVLAIIVAIALSLPVHGLAAAQAGPEFKLGFKALADQIRDVVGDPLENEHFNLSNGNSEQRTSTGLMVWRKADNWTAFTNGYMSWINGPNGVESRLNVQRFAWEKDPPAPTSSQPTQQPSAAATPAPAPTAIPAVAPRRTYDADVKAMDARSAGPGVAVKNLMADVNEEWSRIWGWKPSRPTTVYLYFDGYAFADGIGTVSGSQLSASQRDYYAKNVAGVAMSRDATTTGFAVVMNLGYRYGQPTWESEIKTVLIHEYTHVMQQDVAGGAGPTWFKEGMAELMAYVRVQDSPYLVSRLHWVAEANNQGRLPTLRQLQANWTGTVTTSQKAADEAYGTSYLAVKFLADKVGGMPLRQVLEKTAAGSDFDTALASITGYTVDRLDSEYRTTIPKY